MATLPFFAASEVAVMAGVQQLPCCMLTTRSFVHEPALSWCRSRILKAFPRAPCQATQTRPFASVAATAFTSLPAFSERLIGSESFPLSYERAQISKFDWSCFGQLLFSDQNTHALPLPCTATLHL